ncbi:MAG TPA: hypothetical protein VK774_05285, partial [Solirubrobacteraceae bacterium]|nr:hypothetical protein [Solirubrobacteraceae bacterium]
SSRDTVDAIGVASLLFTTAGLIAAAVTAATDGNYAGAACASLAVITVCGALWLYQHRHKRRSPPLTSEFTPFKALSDTQAWPRSEDTKRLSDLLTTRTQGLPVVVGSSGVGKSTLLQVLVKSYVERSFPHTSYTVAAFDLLTLPRDVQSAAVARHEAPLILILDHFERWLMYASRLPEAERNTERAALEKAFRLAEDNQNLIIAIGVRREWYYDLGFLGTRVPSPADACGIESPSLANPDGELQQAILTSFAKVVEVRSVASGIIERIGASGRLSPLESQIVGAAVEMQVERGAAITLEYFDAVMGGPSGAIDRYFEIILDGSKDPRLCTKILCTLSVRMQLRRPTRLHEVIVATSDEGVRVRRALGYLAERGLIVKQGVERYGLVHDFVGDYFSAKSSEVLTPTERDNVMVYASTDSAHNEVVLTGDRYEEVRSRRNMGKWVAGACTLILSVRLAYLGIDTTVIGPALARPIASSFFDVDYLVTYLPVVAWIFYVGLFFDAVLDHLNESGLARLASLGLLIMLVVGAAINVAVPFVWLAVIAIGGIAFSAKLILLSRHPDLSRTACNRLVATGWSAVCNLAFAGLIGGIAAAAGFTYVDANHHVNVWLYGNLLLAAMATYWSAMLFPRHLSRRATSQWIGLLGRRRSGVVG